MAVHVCNHTTPNLRWEAEAGESLEAEQAGSLVYSPRTKKKPCSKQGGSQRLTQKLFSKLHKQNGTYTMSHIQKA